MIKDYCKYCKPGRRKHCEITGQMCKMVKIELWRIEKGRKKHTIEVIYEHEMGGVELSTWNMEVYGKYRDD